MPLIHTCSCNARFRVPAEHAGKKIKCPKCGKVLTIDAASTKSASAHPAVAPSAKTTKPRQSRPVSWPRRFLWLVPAAACLVLVLLIATVPGVRQVVFRTNDDEPAKNDDKPEKPKDKKVAGKKNKPKEPELEVLAPAAAKDPGRRLPRLLLVGPRENMFRYLEDAVAVAIPGDITEIRTNKPLLVALAGLHLKKWVKDKPLTIRAGKGFQPVVRRLGSIYQFKFRNVDLYLQGIHFVDTSIYCDGNVRLKGCSFTVLAVLERISKFGTCLVLVNTQKRRSFLAVNDCLFRNAAIGLSGPRISTTIDNWGSVAGIHSWSGLHFDNYNGHSIRITNSTFLRSSILNLPLKNGFPSNKVKFEMRHCFIDGIVMGPYILETANCPIKNLENDRALTEVLSRIFDKIDIADNYCRLHEDWWWGIDGVSIKKPLIPLPFADKTASLIPRI